MQELLLLTASLLPLAAAPFLAELGRRSTRPALILDIVVTLVVVFIALFHLLPDAWRAAGPGALLVALLGFVIPSGLYRWLSNRSSRRTLHGIFILSLSGLAVHAALDGVALFAPLIDHHGHGPDEDNARWMALGVILHRLPMALAIWWLVRPRLGRGAAATFLITIGVATTVGFAIGGRVWIALSSPGIGLLQAAIAGMLLHVVVEHRDPKSSPQKRPTVEQPPISENKP